MNLADTWRYQRAKRRYQKIAYTIGKPNTQTRGYRVKIEVHAYQDSILLPDVTARVAVEQASTFGWERYVSKSGRVIGMKTFGASAPLKELQRKFGFEPERVTEIAKELIGKGNTR
jgi:hypothetical protein